MTKFLATYVGKSYENALDEREAAQEAFELLDSSASEAQRATWSEQEDRAHENRLKDVKAMDIYLSKIKGGKWPRLRTFLTKGFNSPRQHHLGQSWHWRGWKKNKTPARMSG